MLGQQSPWGSLLLETVCLLDETSEEEDEVEEPGVTTTFPLVTLFSLRGRIRGYLIREVHVDSQERLLHTCTTCYRKKRHKRA